MLCVHNESVACVARVCGCGFGSDAGGADFEVRGVCRAGTGPERACAACACVMRDADGGCAPSERYCGDTAAEL